jgi:MFS transporter, DHA3 family, macrolide efflux protein
MIVTNAASGLTSLITFILLLTGHLDVWTLVCIAIVAAATSTFHYAAFDASYAMLVPDRLLSRANGMMQTTWSLAGIISPALAASIIALPSLYDLARLAPLAPKDGTALVIAIDAVTFLLCAVVLLIVHLPSPTRSDLSASGPSKPSLWADVREGARYIGERPPLLWLIATFAVANLAGAPTGIIVPLLVKFNLAPDWGARGYTFETALALLGVASGLGGVVGGVLMSTWGGLKQYRVYGVLVPMLLAGMLQVMYGLSSFVLVSAAAAFFRAAMHPVLSAHSQAIWQSYTPRELQGRVFSIRRLIAWAILPISIAVAGALVGPLDPGRVFASLGALWALFCVAQLFNPKLLRVETRT